MSKEKPTTKQKLVLSKHLENIRTGNIQPIGKLMREAGYSKSVSEHPKLLTTSQAWTNAINGIDYPRHLQELDELASTKKNSDKDNVLKSKDMLFKLGDKYPKEGTKIVSLFTQIKQDFTQGEPTGEQ